MSDSDKDSGPTFPTKRNISEQLEKDDLTRDSDKEDDEEDIGQDIEKDDDEDDDEDDEEEDIEKDDDEDDEEEDIEKDDDEDDDDEDIEKDDDDEESKNIINLDISKTDYGSTTDTDEDTDEDDVFQKFDMDVQSDFFKKNHPEIVSHSHDEIKKRVFVKRNKKGDIEDPYHRTLPFMTKYEVTNILGIRAKQLDSGATSLITPPTNIIDGYQIARIELQQKKIPFIIRRPIPGGKDEYWHIRDLELLIDV